MTLKQKEDLNNILKHRLKVSTSEIEELCQRWKIVEMALFGSVLREDFREDSDVDILVVFAPQHGWNLFDLVNLKFELENLLNREVDLLQKKEIRNPFRRKEILENHKVIHEKYQS